MVLPRRSVDLRQKGCVVVTVYLVVVPGSYLWYCSRGVRCVLHHKLLYLHSIFTYLPSSPIQRRLSADPHCCLLHSPVISTHPYTAGGIASTERARLSRKLKERG